MRHFQLTAQGGPGGDQLAASFGKAAGPLPDAGVNPGGRQRAFRYQGPTPGKPSITGSEAPEPPGPKQPGPASSPPGPKGAGGFEGHIGAGSA